MANDIQQLLFDAILSQANGIPAALKGALQEAFKTTPQPVLELCMGNFVPATSALLSAGPAGVAIEQLQDFEARLELVLTHATRPEARERVKARWRGLFANDPELASKAIFDIAVPAGHAQQSRF